MRHVTALLVICGLRDYGLPPSIWGLRDDCAHEWGAELEQPMRGSPGKSSTLHGPQSVAPDSVTQGQFCRLCGCWKGALGLEPTPALYVEHMVEVMREVWRVMRDDAVLFLNLGDSYAQASSRKGQSNSNHTYAHANTAFRDERYSGGVNISAKSAGVKPKDLIGIPWMVAFALRDDGWYLRSDIIWAKGLSFCPTYSGSVMPESCRDRPTSAYEHVFLLSKNKRYYYDSEAAREKAIYADHHAKYQGTYTRHKVEALQERGAPNGRQYQEGLRHSVVNSGGRNLRNVFAIPDTLTEFFKFCESQGVDLDALAEAYVDGQRDLKNVFVVNPANFKGSHFATFSGKLIEPMIKAGTSERGCCPSCGAGWVRVVEKDQSLAESRRGNADYGSGELERGKIFSSATPGYTSQIRTLGWAPTCECTNPDAPKHAQPIPFEPVPCTVLDPFGGAGTTALVARSLGRDAILIELNPDYCEMARRRLDGTEEIETTNGDGDAVTMEQAVMFGGVTVE